MMKYTLPTSSPWVVTIEGDRFVVPSTVARLLLLLDTAAKAPKAKPARQTVAKTPKAKPARHSAAKEKKSTKTKKPSKK